MLICLMLISHGKNWNLKSGPLITGKQLKKVTSLNDGRKKASRSSYVSDYPGKSSQGVISLTGWKWDFLTFWDAYKAHPTVWFSPITKVNCLENTIKMLATAMDSVSNDDFIAYIELGGLGHWGESGMFTRCGVFANSSMKRSSCDYCLLNRLS